MWREVREHGVQANNVELLSTHRQAGVLAQYLAPRVVHFIVCIHVMEGEAGVVCRLSQVVNCGLVNVDTNVSPYGNIVLQNGFCEFGAAANVQKLARPQVWQAQEFQLLILAMIRRE